MGMAQNYQIRNHKLPVDASFRLRAGEVYLRAMEMGSLAEKIVESFFGK
jgi:hypothetical protein